jgi:hypothetical protein
MRRLRNSAAGACRQSFSSFFLKLPKEKQQQQHKRQKK